MDYYKIRKLKEEYLLVHDFYEENKQLLKDLTTRSLYKSLMSVSTLQELKNWVAAILKTELAESRYDASKKTYSDNLLYSFLKRTKDMKDEELERAVSDMNELRQEDFLIDYDDEVLLLEKESEMFHLIKPDSILVFKDSYGECMAIGRDAEKLFEEYGWQTATIELVGREVTAMPLHEKCQTVLPKQKTVFCSTEANIKYIQFADELEVDMSHAQQTIDVFRAWYQKDPLVLSTGGLRFYTMVDGVDEEFDFPFISVSKEDIELYRSNAKTYQIVDGRTWNVHQDNYALIADTANFLAFLMQVQDDDDDWENVLSNEYQNKEATWSVLSYNEYVSAKEQYPEEIVMLEHDGFFTSYDEDAIRLARALNQGLWFRNVHGEQVPMVIVSSRVKEAMSETLKILSVHVVDPDEFDYMDRMALCPCFLEGGIRTEVPFKNAAVFKLRDGDFAIRATLEGTMMPVKKIPWRMAAYYLNKREGLIKETCLKAILLWAYHHDSFSKIHYIHRL